MNSAFCANLRGPETPLSVCFRLSHKKRRKPGVLASKLSDYKALSLCETVTLP